MPADEIDRSGFPIDRKRHFELGVPTAPLQEPGRAADDGRVSFVKQAVEVAAAPSQPDRETGANSPSQGSEGVDLHSADQPALGERDLMLTDIGRVAEILLTPVAPMPERPQRPTDPNVVHGRSLDTCAYRSITDGCMRGAGTATADGGH